MLLHQKKTRVILLFLLGIGIAGVIIGWLWQQTIIDMPPVVVHEFGQFASAIRVKGIMDVQLPTAVHRQEHSLSCEIATLKMALQTVGVNVSESELIALLPFDQTPKGRGIWGDPNQGFVGNIDGKMLVDGYGVYWDPIAKLGLRYRRTEIIRGSSPPDVAQHIANGRPVIVWGNYGRPKMYSWKTVDGSPITAVNGEHTRIVTGFNGSIDNPTSFSLIDPIYGPLTWSTTKFMANWGLLGNHAVVVYPYPRWVRAVGDGKVWEISADGQKRHWIKSWEAFVKRGGFREAILEISNDDLSQYERGTDINK